MADYSTASENAADSLNNATDAGFVEEYEKSPNKLRVRRGTLIDQVKSALMLEGLSLRRSTGLFRGAKFKEPRQ